MDPNHAPRHRDTNPPTLRSVLRPSSGSRRSPPQENPSVQFQTPSSRPSSSKSSISMSQIPRDGPIPPVLLPATQSSQQLEELALQLIARLRAQRIAPLPTRIPLSRPEGKADGFPEFRDMMPDKWTIGSGYGPVLDPESVAKLRLHPLLHPILCPPSANKDHIIWNMIYPPTTAMCVRENTQDPFDTFCLVPATFPRVLRLHLASRCHPWEFVVRAKDKSAGVTVGDMLTVLFRYLSVGLNEIDLQSTSIEHRQAITSAHEARVQTLQPEEELDITALDWMVGRTHFAGFVHDIEYLERRFHDTPSNLHVVLCSESEPVSA